jgi:hypothetical protein
VASSAIAVNAPPKPIERAPAPSRKCGMASTPAKLTGDTARIRKKSGIKPHNNLGHFLEAHLAICSVINIISSFSVHIGNWTDVQFPIRRLPFT